MVGSKHGVSGAVGWGGRLAGVLICLGACGDDRRGDCLEGASLECTCTDGSKGAQVCSSEGKLEPCMCTGASGRQDAGGPADDDLDASHLDAGARDSGKRDAGHDAGSERDGALLSPEGGSTNGPDAAADASNGTTDAADGEADASVGNCKPGYYTGELTGEYWPGIGEIIPGIGSTLRVDVSGSPGSLSFVLVKQGASELYALERGCFVGTATAFGEIDKHPFVALLEGTLDCEAGLLTAQMSGYYDLFGFGEQTRYSFQGPLTGVSQADTHGLAGDFQVYEEQPTPNPPGGSGTWSASHHGATAPALPAECEELRNALSASFR